MNAPVEIERKYVIAMPDLGRLASCDGYTVSEIDQTYLESSEGVTHRVRARRYTDKTVYTETKKIRIDKMSAFEDERELAEAEYLALLERRKQGTVTLKKWRHTFDFGAQTFEVDIYPEWVRSAILETELESREVAVTFPDFIDGIAEVTGDKRYSNAAMSHRFPDELV